jgi:hypothetical protein
MHLALALAASALAGWVPARWASGDPKTLELLAETPINCLLLEQPQFSTEFARQAAARGVRTLGVVRPEGEPVEAARLAIQTGLDGVVLEGAFDQSALDGIRKAAASAQRTLIELPPRRLLRLEGDAPVIGTYQGLWPGIHLEEAGAVRARPTGGPWIDTNSGFLRFVRALTDAPIWIANLPPTKTVLPVDRYVQAIADAAMLGARWVVALDEDLNRRLLAREPAALRDWRRIGAHLRYFEEHPEWRALKPYSLLAFVQEPDASALLSGGILDMLGGRHIPVRPVSRPTLSAEAVNGLKMAVTIDPRALTAEQKEALRNVGRAGGTLLNGPPGWKLPLPKDDQITLDKAELAKVDEVWQGINGVIGRGNFGARLFNVSSMLSSLLGPSDGSLLALHLVNYSNYPVESITVQLQGKYSHARLYAPERATRELELYPVAEGTGVDIDRVAVCATLVLN